MKKSINIYTEKPRKNVSIKTIITTKAGSFKSSLKTGEWRKSISWTEMSMIKTSPCTKTNHKKNNNSLQKRASNLTAIHRSIRRLQYVAFAKYPSSTKSFFENVCVWFKGSVTSFVREGTPPPPSGEREVLVETETGKQKPDLKENRKHPALRGSDLSASLVNS